MTCLIESYCLKDVGDLGILVRRSISALMGFVMLTLSLEFHAVLSSLERQKFFTDMLLEVSRHSRCLRLPLKNTVFGLNLM